MILIKSNPRTSGTRHKLETWNFINKKNHKKWFFINKKKKNGRGYNGILTYSKSSPYLKKYCNINYRHFLIKQPSIFINYLHFFKQKCFVGVVKYLNGAFSVIKVINGISPGFFLKNTNLPQSIVMKYFLGYTVLIKWINRRIVFCNIFNSNKNKVEIAKAPGVFCAFINSDDDKEYSRIRIPSGEIKFFFNYTYVNLGRNSNVFNKRRVLGKAGSNIMYGKKPSVRGIAMNPVDHPHGGRAKTNSPERTPWGKTAKFNK